MGRRGQKATQCLWYEESGAVLATTQLANSETLTLAHTQIKLSAHQLTWSWVHRATCLVWPKDAVRQ